MEGRSRGGPRRRALRRARARSVAARLRRGRWNQRAIRSWPGAATPPGDDGSGGRAGWRRHRSDPAAPSAASSTIRRSSRNPMETAGGAPPHCCPNRVAMRSVLRACGLRGGAATLGVRRRSWRRAARAALASPFAHSRTQVPHVRPHPIRPLAHRLPAHRRGADGVVQLPLRAAPWRDVPAADRGHRPGAEHRGCGEADPGQPGLARPFAGRAAGVPEPARGAACRGRARAAGEGPRLSRLRHAGGVAGGAGARGLGGTAAALRRGLARPRSRRRRRRAPSRRSG